MAQSNLTPEQLEELVAKAQKGDTESFAGIYDHFVDPIYRYIYFRVDKEEALDLTENVFLKVWENIKSYKTGRKYLSSWIYRIAHNLVIDHYRTGREHAELHENIADDKRETDPSFMTERKLSQEVLMKAIKKVNRKYQQVILLKYVNDLDNREIARIMGRSEGSLRILKFRALKALRQVLESMNIRYE